MNEQTEVRRKKKTVGGPKRGLILHSFHVDNFRLSGRVAEPAVSRKITSLIYAIQLNWHGGFEFWNLP